MLTPQGACFVLKVVLLTRLTILKYTFFAVVHYELRSVQQDYHTLLNVLQLGPLNELEFSQKTQHVPCGPDAHSTKNSLSLSLYVLFLVLKQKGSAGIWKVQLVKPPKLQFS